MHPNEALLTRFYTAFRQKDYRAMQACYADDARFSDPVFLNLDATEVRAMWEMLIQNGRDLELEFANVQADDRHGRAEWTARYTFSATGRKVVNRIRAEFEFEDGKIRRHTDSFSFYTWARQALGATGWVLGWTAFLRNNVRQKARRSLERFIVAQVG